ncbi:enterochelin esterase-like enzyme [Paenibacillus phyllosphaerae]|uniref:Enterochelin esterase-like enzyme n=1 Tax=Paenibacillus phyllosphaerae TaxID=274593 RepID=A0A7W5FMJ6_9BACL|nr:alpha/beta hydrolase-fold protein [Paenibacillus phyllosphaerae]MBB3110336.1 enterochelin esterase-like enzyme [Paenibacillus phyllosphaerae]
MTDSRYLKRTIVKDTVPSQYLPEGQRELRVFLPPGYNEVLSYPVVYCQDGEDFFNFGRVATIATQLILDEGIEPFIIVGVDVDKKKRTDEYAPDGPLHDGYVRFFADELVPYIEAKYAARRVKEERILAGDSLGGTVSLHIALRYPNLFNRIIALSGAFYPSSQAIAAQAGDLSDLELFMIVGLQEDAYETDRGVFNFVAINREMKQLLEAKGAVTHYGEHDGKHVWGFWQKHIPASLKTFLRQES